MHSSLRKWDSTARMEFMLRLCLAAALSLAAISVTGQSLPEDLVHPLVGTANEGQTYPATGVPFAMTHWTPQTRAGEIKCVAPYYFADTAIQGFRGSHFLSGRKDFSCRSGVPFRSKQRTCDSVLIQGGFDG